jgi:two-component system, chemotaxis family, chemotaxis protein CheY
MKKKIFVIEDNRTEGLLLRLSLNEFPELDIQYLSSGKELMDRLGENPDIIILDLILPDISGHELIRIMREYNPEIRIIVVSAQKDIDLIARIQAEGIYNYVVKSESAIAYLKTILKDLFLLLKE